MKQINTENCADTKQLEHKYVNNQCNKAKNEILYELNENIKSYVVRSNDGFSLGASSGCKY